MFVYRVVLAGLLSALASAGASLAQDGAVARGFLVTPSFGVGHVLAGASLDEDNAADGPAHRALESMAGDRLAMIGALLEQVGLSGDGGQVDTTRLADLLDGLEGEPLDFDDNGESWYHGAVDEALRQGGGDPSQLTDIGYVDIPRIATLLRDYLDGYGAYSPVIPTSFPYIDAADRSPIPVNVRGTYLGVVEGLAYLNTSLEGIARFNVDAQGFAVNIDGRFDFGSHGVVHITQASQSAPLEFHRDQQSFLGGNITSTQYTHFDFYGPQAQEFGGYWGFVVTGGSEPGLVSGSFKTAR